MALLFCLVGGRPRICMCIYMPAVQHPLRLAARTLTLMPNPSEPQSGTTTDVYLYFPEARGAHLKVISLILSSNFVSEGFKL